MIKKASMFDRVRDNLDSCKGRLPDVADATGISYRTLQKITLREVKNPGVRTVELLDAYFDHVSKQQEFQRQEAITTTNERRGNSKMRKRNHWLEKAKIDKHVPIPKIRWSKIAGRDIAREMQEGDSIFCKTQNEAQYVRKLIAPNKHSVYRALRRREGEGFRVWKIRRVANSQKVWRQATERQVNYANA